MVRLMDVIMQPPRLSSKIFDGYRLGMLNAILVARNSLYTYTNIVQKRAWTNASTCLS